MKVTFLGGAREVGKSALLVEGKKSKLVLDYGAHTGKEPSFPIHVKPREVASILLTHAHLDHSGGVPLFYLSKPVQLVTSPVTLELSMILLEDFIKLSGFFLPFENQDLLTMSRNTRKIAINDSVDIDSEFRARFPNSGHIPGGAMIITENDGRRFLYTGDINLKDSQLMKGADLEFSELDAIITESTYSQQEHKPREKTETEFVEFANEVVERGGILLVPAFSVGRAQEIACLLRAKNFKHNVVMDGMALKVNEVLYRHQDSLRDPELFRKALENVEVIKGSQQRKQVVKKPGVIVSPAGMLAGGASVFYNQEISRVERNAISIVAFQVPGTPGRTLLDRGLIIVNGRTEKVKAEIRRFDFSGHAGRSELFDLFRHVKGKPKVYTIHGDGDSCEIFAREIQERYGLEASAPKIGDTVVI